MRAYGATLDDQTHIQTNEGRARWRGRGALPSAAHDQLGEPHATLSQTYRAANACGAMA
ncbi:gp38 [Burkholderia phage KS14]|uniref:Gp38 n=1 Tax=Burkholderia phage KS14 TaxID=910475 RepID=E5FFJ1_9CAUD|nr:gp38 [Burkholderia phage KS14]ADP02383.1 gp38 [Burkholderia phage KS14]